MAMVVDAKAPELIVQAPSAKKILAKERASVCDVMWACVLNDYLDGDDDVSDLMVHDDDDAIVDDDNNSLTSKELLKLQRKKLKKKKKDRKKKKLQAAKTLLDSMPDNKDESGGLPTDNTFGTDPDGAEPDWEETEWDESRDKSATTIIKPPRNNYVFETPNSQSDIGQEELESKKKNGDHGNDLKLNNKHDRIELPSEDRYLPSQKSVNDSSKDIDHDNVLVSRTGKERTKKSSKSSTSKDVANVTDSKNAPFLQLPDSIHLAANPSYDSVPKDARFDLKNRSITKKRSDENPIVPIHLKNRKSSTDGWYGRGELLGSDPATHPSRGSNLSSRRGVQRRQGHSITSDDMRQQYLVLKGSSSDKKAVANKKPEEVRYGERRANVHHYSSNINVADSRNDDDESVWALDDNKRSKLDEIRQKKLDRKQALERIRHLRQSLSNVPH
jgi:hypothetical protein